MADLNLGLPHPILLTSECSSYTDRNYYQYDYGNSDQSRNQKYENQEQQNESRKQENQKQQGSRYLDGSGGDCFHDQSATWVPFYLNLILLVGRESGSWISLTVRSFSFWSEPCQGLRPPSGLGGSCLRRYVHWGTTSESLIA